jgi:hypothetical protein
MGCLGPEALKSRHGGSCRIHFTVNRYVFLLDLRYLEKDFRSQGNVCKALPPLAFDVIAVGRILSGGHEGCCPKNSDQRRTLKTAHRRREEV